MRLLLFYFVVVYCLAILVDGQSLLEMEVLQTGNGNKGKTSKQTGKKTVKKHAPQPKSSLFAWMTGSGDSSSKKSTDNKKNTPASKSKPKTSSSKEKSTLSAAQKKAIALMVAKKKKEAAATSAQTFIPQPKKKTKSAIKKLHVVPESQKMKDSHFPGYLSGKLHTIRNTIRENAVKMGSKFPDDLNIRETDGAGSHTLYNGFTYYKDNSGRVIRVSGTLWRGNTWRSLSWFFNEGDRLRGPRKNFVQSLAKSNNVQAGHLLGHQFCMKRGLFIGRYGECDDPLNLVPMHNSVNLGHYKKFENKLWDVAASKAVKVEILVSYGNSKNRNYPSKFDITFHHPLNLFGILGSHRAIIYNAYPTDTHITDPWYSWPAA